MCTGKFRPRQRVTSAATHATRALGKPSKRLRQLRRLIYPRGPNYPVTRSPLADFWRYINLYVCRPMYGEGAGCPFPKNLTSAVGPFGPRASDLRASPLTPNRRIGPSQHDGLDPLCAVCMPLMQELRNDTNHWMTATVQWRRPLDARHTQ